MGASIIESKLTLPELPRNHLPRPHLIAAIDAVQPNNTVFVIAGPGYGKSTLLVEWIRQHPDRVWYSLDHSDRDPAVFFSYFLSAFQEVWPGFGADLARQLKSPGSLDTKLFSHSIIEEIEVSLDKSANPTSVYLVLEDLHFLSGRPELQDSIGLMIERMPKSVRLAISSREQPPYLNPTAGSVDHVFVLKEGDLRYSDDELDSLLPNQEKTAEEVRRLMDWTEGWPFGIQLLLNSIVVSTTPMGPRFDFRKDEDPLTQIFNYLALEVFNHQSSTLQRFLVQSATLETITIEACNEIFERDDSRQLLKLTKDRNLFLEHRRRNGNTFRFHPLFSAFLNSLSAKVGDEVEWKKWGNRAADYYRKHRQWITAFNHARRINNEDLAAEILAQGFQQLRANGFWESIQDCLDRLSPNAYLNLPTLWVMQGYLWEDLGLHAQAKGAFHQALKFANPEHHKETLVRAWLGLGIVSERMGDIAAARQSFEKASEFSKSAELNVQYMAKNALGMIELSTGRYPRALKYFKDCLEISAPLGHSVQAQAMNNLGSTVQGLGDFTSARHWFEQSLSIRREANETPGIVSCLGNLSYCNVHMGALDEAIQQADEAIELGGVGFHPAMQAILLSNKGDALALKADYEHAEACYRESLEKREALEDQPGLVHIWTRFAALRRRQKSWKEAIFCARQAEKIIRDKNIGHSARHPAQLELIAILIAHQPTEEAEVLLSRLIDEHRNVTGNLYGLANCLFYLSCIYKTQGREYLEVIEESLSLAASHGYEFSFGHLFKDNPDLLPIAIKENIQPSFIEKLLPELGDAGSDVLTRMLKDDDSEGQLRAVERMLSLKGDTKWQHFASVKVELSTPAKKRLNKAILAILEADPEPLHVTTFGRFSLKRGDHEIKSSDWVNRRSETLMKILLGQYGHQIDRLELIGLLWPKARPNNTTDQKYRVGFNNLYSRLRKVLEPYLPDRYPSRYVREANNSYGLYLPSGSWVDFLAFETAIDRGDKNRRTGNIENAILAYEEALDLYRGEYLVEDSYAEWRLRIQERLHMRAVNASLELMKYYFDQGKFYRVVNEGGRLMGLESWNENGCSLLIEALLKLGRIKDARTAYHKCKASMQEELGILESSDLDSLGKMQDL